MTLSELNQHLELREQLNKANEMLRALREAAYPKGQRLDGMPHASGVSDKVGDLAIEIADLTTEIEMLQAEIAEAEKPIEEFITEIHDAQTRMVFRLRFMRCCTWKEVAALIKGGNTEASVKTICYRYLESCSV